jgi:hypothetical protein
MLDLVSGLLDGAADSIADAVDGGESGGYLEIRTGAPPGIDQAATGTLLASHPLADPAFAAASGGVATLAAIDNATILATGSAGYFRILDSNDTPLLEGTCGTEDADLILDTVDFEVGSTSAIDSGSLTVAGA